MQSIIEKHYNDIINKKIAKITFDNYNKKGDLVIKCLDGDIKTKSKVFLDLSEYYSDYYNSNIDGNRYEIEISSNMNIIKKVLQIFYQEFVIINDFDEFVEILLCIQFLLPNNFVKNELDSLIKTMNSKTKIYYGTYKVNTVNISNTVTISNPQDTTIPHIKTKYIEILIDHLTVSKIEKKLLEVDCEYLRDIIKEKLNLKDLALLI